MDFSNRNDQDLAERGAELRLVDPVTREPLGPDDKPCIVIVRGSASRPIQQILRQKQKAAKAAEMVRRADKVKASKEDADDGLECMEDVHERSIEHALPFIIGFKNITMGGVDPSGDEKLTADLLRTSFPSMRPLVDDNGTHLLDDKGVPRFEMATITFAQQVSDFAQDANFMSFVEPN